MCDTGDIKARTWSSLNTARRLEFILVLKYSHYIVLFRKLCDHLHFWRTPGEPRGNGLERGESRCRHLRFLTATLKLHQNPTTKKVLLETKYLNIILYNQLICEHSKCWYKSYVCLYTSATLVWFTAVVLYKSWNKEAFQLNFSFSRLFFGYSGSFKIPNEFWDEFFYFCKKYCWHFNNDCICSIGSFA